MNVVLHEQPIAAYCWKMLIALEERQVPYETVLVKDRTPLKALRPRATAAMQRSSSPATATGQFVSGWERVAGVGERRGRWRSPLPRRGSHESNRADGANR